MARSLSVEELMAGAGTTYKVVIPGRVLDPEGTSTEGGEVEMRPLTVRDLQRLTQAAKEQQMLTSVLMVQQALIKPKLTLEQAGSLPAGLVQFLLQRVNAISGMALEPDELEQTVRAPLSRACFLLAREFGWSPAQCADLTVGQILAYLEMMAKSETAGTTRD
jgi:hypothetical protein